METIPVWILILLVGIVASTFWYGLRIFLNRFYDDRPIYCEMCSKLVFKSTNAKCPNCSHSI
jgi:hypothetical protein